MNDARHDPAAPKGNGYDCRTAEQRHEDAAQLALRIDNLVDAVEAMGRERASQAAAITELRSQLAALTSAAMTDLGRESHRITAQEGEIAALKLHVKAQAAAIDRIAAALTVINLRVGYDARRQNLPQRPRRVADARRAIALQPTGAA